MLDDMRIEQRSALKESSILNYNYNCTYVVMYLNVLLLYIAIM